MNTKLQELTDKIYQEGVEKGNSEAKKIAADAQKEAADIIAKAQKEAEKIIADAQIQVSELEKNTQSELRLFARQSVDALRTEIANLVCGEIVSNSVKPATADNAFMQKIILTLVQDWAKNDQLIIEAKDAKALTEYFTANAKTLLDKGLKITEANSVKTGFAIVSETNGYKVTFGEDELVAYFKEFLRPKLVEMLF